MASSRLEKIGTIYTRKETNEKLLNSLSDIVSTFKADIAVMTENEQKLEQLIGMVMKFIQQCSQAQNQKLNKLEELCTSYKTMVEGLLTRGAIKPDDRPLWFDVYRAFPPITEPKFARSKPEISPIRQILYKEDSIRVKFHSNGYGLAAINLLNKSTNTQIKQLTQQYEKLKVEGVPESDLIQKSLEVVAAERQSEMPKFTKIIAKNPESVSAQVLADADLKNIFKE